MSATKKIRNLTGRSVQELLAQDNSDNLALKITPTGDIVLVQAEDPVPPEPNLPDPPAENGTYLLKVTGGVATWEEYTPEA